MRVAVVLLLACFPLAALAAETSLTVYSKASPGSVPPSYYRPAPNAAAWDNGAQIPGYAVVREQRPVKLEKERGAVKFSDVAALIDPTTVTFKSLTDPEGTSVLEQDYQFDLVSTQELLQRYLGQVITAEQYRGEAVESFTGTLLSSAGGMVLQSSDGKVTSLNGFSNIRFPDLPGGLMTKPTLVWDIITGKPGAHVFEVSYQTEGITWWADYNAVFTEGKDANSGFLDLGAWVSIVNKSGGGYKDARLKLVAGDVQRAPEGGGARVLGKNMMAMAAPAEMQADGFQEKAFFEYHLYTLGRPTTIPDNATKQIELFPQAQHVPVKKLLVYDGAQGAVYYGGVQTSQDFGVPSNKKVSVYLRIRNDKESKLGMPLPAGRLRVSKKDEADGSLEFVGEDVIDHTSKDEELKIKLGEAFDVTGERRQVDFRIDQARRVMDESFEITLRNHKEQDVDVLIKEQLYRGSHWQITEKTGDYEKLDSQTIHFPVTVKKDGEKIVRYTVRYTW